MFLLVDYDEVLSSFANELSEYSNAFSKEEYIPQILTGFLADSRCLHLTFVTICLLSVICKQYLKQYNYSLHRPIRAPDQIPDRF